MAEWCLAYPYETVLIALAFAWAISNIQIGR